MGSKGLGKYDGEDHDATRNFAMGRLLYIEHALLRLGQGIYKSCDEASERGSSDCVALENFIENIVGG